MRRFNFRFITKQFSKGLILIRINVLNVKFDNITMAEATARVGTPQFRQACYPIVTEYLNTEDGKRQLSCIIDSHFAEKRDSATKWINFIKLVGGIIIAALLMYGGQTIVQTNLKTQQTVIEALRGLGD